VPQTYSGITSATADEFLLLRSVELRVD
jgi:hypothetical protein